MSDIIKSYHFETNIPGPHLLVFGAVHGNEPCGSQAAIQCIGDLEAGKLALTAGSLTIVPVCNPAALEKNQRFLEQNLNRVFKTHAEPAAYEEHLAHELTALVDQCDVLLDLHSQGSEGKPFVFQDYEDEKTEGFAQALGVGTILKGWPEMFASEADLNAGDTVGYAHWQGKTAVLVECGQHSDPQAKNVAYKTIMNSMIHLGMLDATGAADRIIPEIIRAQKIVTVPDEGWTLRQKWGHLQDVGKDQVLASNAAGQELKAPCDGVVILPKYAAKKGEEWFYLGIREVLKP
ncbi:MAG: succinylglutamate desuccinylase [Micavibrio sp.]|nr:succinylglutamate desuccinylase [Micavibrio sp.]